MSELTQEEKQKCRENLNEFIVGKKSSALEDLLINIWSIIDDGDLDWEETADGLLDLLSPIFDPDELELAKRKIQYLSKENEFLSDRLAVLEGKKPCDELKRHNLMDNSREY